MDLVNILRENITLSGDSFNNYINEQIITLYNNIEINNNNNNNIFTNSYFEFL